MKIAMISEHASPLATLGSVDSGGQNVYVAYVARELASKGHSIDVYTRRDDPDLPAVIPFCAGVNVIPVKAGPARFVPKEAMLPLIREFSEGIAHHCARLATPYDVVHANFFMSGLAALRLQKQFGIPFVITFHALGRVRRIHQGAADGFPGVRVDIEKTLVDNADRVIAECPQDRDDLVNLYGARKASVEIVPCGVDMSEFGIGDSLVRQRLGLGADEFVVLQLGRVLPRKGIDNVVRGIAELRRRHGIDSKLLVVGGESVIPDPHLTPEIARLQRIANEEGVADRVVFTGRRSRAELRDYYYAADVFVTTPWYEPFGITPLEAMACGRPVVGAAVGGIAHTVLDGVTGLLVPPKDPVALAERLAWLRANPAATAAFGLAGMRRVREAFTWDHVATALQAVYRSIVRHEETEGEAPAQRAAGL